MTGRSGIRGSFNKIRQSFSSEALKERVSSGANSIMGARTLLLLEYGQPFYNIVARSLAVYALVTGAPLSRWLQTLTLAMRASCVQSGVCASILYLYYWVLVLQRIKIRRVAEAQHRQALSKGGGGQMPEALTNAAAFGARADQDDPIAKLVHKLTMQRNEFMARQDFPEHVHTHWS